MSVHRRGIRAERGGIFPPYIAFCRRTCQRRPLLRAFETACGPLGPEGRSLMENTPFGGFSAGLRRPNQLAAVSGILVFGGLAAIFAELEFAVLFNWQRLAAKRSGYASLPNFAALRLSVAAEWDRKAAVQIGKTYRSFRHRRSAVAKKNEAKIEWMVSQGSSPHKTVLFRPNMYKLQYDMKAYIVKKNVLVHD
jgi:hypothetical protein